MSTTVAYTNYSAHPFALQEMSTLDAFAGSTPGTATRVRKQVNADDYSSTYDTLAGRGLKIVEDGTARPGLEASTATATAAATTHIVEAVTGGVDHTLTLQKAATVGDGFRMYIFIATKGVGNLVVDADGAETIDGNLTATLSAAGALLAIESDGISAWTTIV